MGFLRLISYFVDVILRRGRGTFYLESVVLYIYSYTSAAINILKMGGKEKINIGCNFILGIMQVPRH